MRGRWNMMDWELEKWKRDFSSSIDLMITQRDNGGHPVPRDLTQEDLCPYNVRDILEALGYEYLWMEDNGWEQDTWYNFKHPETGVALTLFYCGALFSMKIYLTEEDDA